MAVVGVATESGGGGDLTHDESYVATGSGFGTGPTVVIYDDFSTGTLDALVRSTSGIVGTWETGTGDDQVFRSSAVSRGVHSRCAFHDLSEATGFYVAALCMNETFTDDWYIDWWHRVDKAPASDYAQWTRNYKTFRFYDNTGSGDYYALTHLGPGTDDSTLFFTRNGPDYVSCPITADQWAHFKLRHRIPQTFASTDVVNFSRAVNGSTASTLYNGTFRGSDGTTQYPTELRIGDYWAFGGVDSYLDNVGGEVYTSSVYMQRGWARVELGNHATYASATLTEIQRPTSWSGSSITYVVNKGLLSSGTVYEYIFDSSNALVQSTARTMT